MIDIVGVTIYKDQKSGRWVLERFGDRRPLFSKPGENQASPVGDCGGGMIVTDDVIIRGLEIGGLSLVKLLLIIACFVAVFFVGRWTS